MEEDFKELLHEAFSIEKELLLKIKDEIDYIINNNITDIEYIESTLDSLLNINFIDVKSDFLRLCYYYKNIDKDNTMEYIKIYKEYKESGD